MSTPRVLSAALLILLANTTLANARDPKKGTIKEVTTTNVTLDGNGRAVVGGNAPLGVKDTAEGYLLTITISENNQTKVWYLAYPMDEKATPEVILVDKPAPGCYWAPHHYGAGRRHGHGNMNILEIDAYSVKTGALAGYWVVRDKQAGDRLTLVEKSKSPSQANFIGKMTEFDNLEDGL